MTVAQAKANMTLPEALKWASYFRKYGYASQSGATIPHVQRGFALLAAILINVNGGFQGGRKAKVSDFLPDHSEDQAGDAEDIATLLSSLSTGKRRDAAPKKLWKRAKRR